MYAELEQSAITLAKALADNNAALAKAGIVRDIPVSAAAHTTTTTYVDLRDPKGVSAHQQLLVESAKHKLLPLAQNLHAALEAALPSIGPLTWSLQTSVNDEKPRYTLWLWNWNWSTSHPTPKKVAQRLCNVAERMRPVRTGLRTFCVQPNQKTSWTLRAHAPEDALLAWHVMRFSSFAPSLERLEKVEAEVVETYNRHGLVAALRAHHFQE